MVSISIFFGLYRHVIFYCTVSETSDHFKIEILTPVDPEQRGAQLSLRIVGVEAVQLFRELEALGVCVSSTVVFTRTHSFLSLTVLVGSPR